MKYELLERLTPCEERDLLDGYYLGDEHSKDILIEHNLYLVVLTAKNYVDEKNSIEDLVQVGTVGLIKAIDSYNSKEHSSFSSYVVVCIEKELQKYVKK